MTPSTLVRRCLTAVLLASATLLPRLVFAQAAPPAPPPPVREGSAEFAFVGTTGNASTQTVGIGGDLIYRPSPWETRLKVTYVRNEAESQLRAQAFVLAARAQRSITPRLAAFGQYGYLRDRFAGISARNSADAGLAFSALASDRQKLALDASLGYANEQRMLGPDLSTGIVGAGGLYTLKLSATSTFTEDGRFVIAMDNSSDWRYTNVAALTARINSLLSLKLSNTIRHLNLPVVGFKSTDAITSVALVAKF